MIKIDFPSHPFKIKEEEGKEFIFDELRKLWVKLTPEEWVRQNFLQYLVQVKKYPASLLAIEKEIMVGDMRKRCDIVVYNRDSKPWLIVECKEMQFQLSEKTITQILSYNLTLKVNCLVITNGTYTYGITTNKNGSFSYLSQLPDYDQ